MPEMLGTSSLASQRLLSKMADKTKQIKYSYCVDENGELVHINSLTDTTRHARKLFCLQCGQEMVANLGKKKTWYFSHKAETACDGESYLHKLAKRLIREKFMSSDNFPITFTRDVPCRERDTCICAVKESCVNKGEKITNDLRLWRGKVLYDNCEEEVSIDNFRADLLLTYTKDCNREPIFIEVFKSHQSSDVKVNSKYRIIETIPIKSEDDIVDILHRGFVEGENCTLYNFNPHLPSIRKNDIPIDRFVLFNSGAAIVYNALDYSVLCESMNQRYKSNSVAELNMRPQGINIWGMHNQSETLDAYQTGLLYFVKKGMPIRNCILCRYRKYNDAYNNFVCVLYKKLGHESPFPKQTMGNHCQQYELSPELRNYTLEDLEKEVSKVTTK